MELVDDDTQVPALYRRFKSHEETSEDSQEPKELPAQEHGCRGQRWDSEDCVP